MELNNRFIVYAFLGFLILASLWAVVSSILDYNNKMTPQERKEHTRDKQEQLKKEYEEKKALSVEKAKAKKEEKQREKEERKNLKKSIKEQKPKRNFFSWLKPKVKKTTVGNITYVVDSSEVKKFVPPLFGGSNEKSPIDEKMEKIIKELKDL